ncbi:MAG TPA: imidazoleglycerol-phosphate dehydratase HisB [Anaerohalosphaeraceae bacterium]|nr:imidazoleglycerol-phosphate dehydratase HisB [Anaerohalosphaeraceae bacterium]HPB92879.1 imidazoleglycerol-phosphate dehydratase HisB [Anaerohalosphaeraceae bacterium]HRT23235.1 imidazoleglycerol-phosphate dehydratase HisB [Anaerohalosphaeraceae bacterium]
MKNRTASISRKTKETDILVQMNLDGQGSYEIDTGVGFFDHMLTHLSKHSGIDLTVKAKGDLEVDAHHTVEDVGLCAGEALQQALGEKRGIQRFGHAVVPMEDAKAEVSVDLSGRPYLVYRVQYASEKIGDFDVQCVEEFWRAFSSAARMNLHIEVPYGTNSHHIAESIYKAVGQAVGQAVRISGNQIPSTKGTL